MKWILERHIFADNHDRLAEAVRSAGHDVIDWNDSWITDMSPPAFENQRVLFHGSLGNAHLVANALPWSPGAFCNTEAFQCSSWYSYARDWLVHPKWVFTTVRRLVESARSVLEPLGYPKFIFVRPDSPLKPFSGRVLEADQISYGSLDYGFYYEDIHLPIVVALTVNVEQEWRACLVNNHPDSRGGGLRRTAGAGGWLGGGRSLIAPPRLAGASATWPGPE